jgi:hypothetical protein
VAYFCRADPDSSSRAPQGKALLNPFGEESSEQEFKILGQRYKEYFFNHAPFNRRALDKNAYLIFGRRGAGKSSLAHFFTFQDQIPNCHCVDVDEPVVFQDVLSRIAELADTTTAVATPQIVRVWEATIWQLIFNEYRDHSEEIRAACLFDKSHKSVSKLILDVLRHLLSRVLKDDKGTLAREAETMLESGVAKTAQASAIQFMEKEPVILAVDTLEHYDVSNDHMMRAVAALVECASRLNTEYSDRGLHIKVFIAAESASHLVEGYMSNVLKYVRNEIYMHWRHET